MYILFFYLINVVFGIHTIVPLINDYKPIFAVILAFNLSIFINLIYLSYFKKSKFQIFLLFLIAQFLTIVINYKTVTSICLEIFEYYHYLYYALFSVECVSILLLSFTLYKYNNPYEIKKVLNI